MEGDKFQVINLTKELILVVEKKFDELSKKWDRIEKEYSKFFIWYAVNCLWSKCYSGFRTKEEIDW